MRTMKAVRIHAYGGPETLIYEDAPLPDVRMDEVLIRVHAVAVNPFDWKVREGYVANWFNHTLPLIVGWDVSGTIEVVGASATGVQAGDAVYAWTDVARDGAYAEYVAVRAADVVAKPQSLDYTHAAAVPQAALTAWECLIETASLEPGQTVLIHAAAGGVGHFAVQLAKWHGAQVVGTASARNHDFLRQLGVDVAIDYTTTRFEDVAQGVDLVLDLIGGETQQRSFAVLRPGGMLISVVEPPAAEAATAHRVEARFVSTQQRAGILAELSGLIDGGQIKPVVSTILPLAEVRQAHELSQSGHTRGKIVLRVVD